MVKFYIGDEPGGNAIWRNFASGKDRDQEAGEMNWVDIALVPHNGRDIHHDEDHIEFDTEEDLLAFILKFG